MNPIGRRTMGLQEISLIREYNPCTMKVRAVNVISWLYQPIILLGYPARGARARRYSTIRAYTSAPSTLLASDLYGRDMVPQLGGH